MTIATDRGFKIGELYRVTADSDYYLKDMIVRFYSDDQSSSPWFDYVSGPTVKHGYASNLIAISLDRLVPFEENKPQTSNKHFLELYIQQQYPNDKVLKALVESI